MRSSLLILGLFFGLCWAAAQKVDPLFFKAFSHGGRRASANVIVVESDQEPIEPPVWVNACPTLPTPAPTTDVNNLKPGHIKVVMSMGDSITAAMSAKDKYITNLSEYRGISHCIGGDAGVITMANLLKQYSPNLIGQSTGTGLRTSNGTGFNAAVSGALNVDMRGQAEWLVERLHANTKVDIKNDWKVLTIWIGSNNLCAVCKNALANDANDFEKRLTDTLDYISANVPRVFVNLIANLDVSKLNSFTTGTCGSLHIYECQCTTNNPSLVVSTAKEYQARAYKIADTFNSKKNPEFAVVVQPFLIDTYIFNRTYLSTADCFHPSAICHQALAIGLWNSMITPVADKKHAFVQDEPPLCATESSMLYTK